MTADLADVRHRTAAELIDDGWLTTNQAATYTQKHKVTILKHAAAGTLVSSQAGRGRGRRYKRADLDRWLHTAPRLPRA